MPSRALLGLYAFIVATSIWFMVDTGTAGELSTENKTVESVGAFMFFVGSAFFFACLVRSSSAGLRQMRNLYYLGLGLVFFMAFGEEMSWGQHIFGWGSPSAFEGNVQGETNLHNLQAFHWRPGASPKGDSNGVLILSLGSLVTIFILGFTFALPLAYRALSPFHRFVDKFEIPVHPLRIGALAFVAFVLSRVGLAIHPNTGWPMRELMEMQFAVVVAAIAYAGFARLKEEDHVEQQARPHRAVPASGVPSSKLEF